MKNDRKMTRNKSVNGYTETNDANISYNFNIFYGKYISDSVKVEECINFAIQNEPIDTNLISDGYHTFGELYEHRITNFVVLCRMLTEHACDIDEKDLYEVWRSKKHSDGELAFGGGWFVLGINKEAGKQITYHLPIDAWDKTHFAEELETAPEWDGHTPEDVLNRLATL